MIPFLIKHKNLIIGFGAFLLLSGLLWWKDHQIESLEQKLAAANVTAESYKQGLAELQAQSARREAALEQEAASGLARAKTLENLLGQIEGASNEEDCPVSPVLRGAIDRLYGHNANNSGRH